MRQVRLLMRTAGITLLVLGLGASALAAGGEGARDPLLERWSRIPPEPPAPSGGATRLPARMLIRFFQRYISPVDGPSCSFTPTCSRYGLEAIGKHGLLLGIPMTAERVLRDHRPSAPAPYPIEEHGGRFYYADPVEANDFWWAERGEDGG